MLRHWTTLDPPPPQKKLPLSQATWGPFGQIEFRTVGTWVFFSFFFFQQKLLIFFAENCASRRWSRRGIRIKTGAWPAKSSSVWWTKATSPQTNVSCGDIGWPWPWPWRPRCPWWPWIMTSEASTPGFTDWWINRFTWIHFGGLAIN